MTLNKILISLITLPAFAFTATEADLDIFIITPNIETIELGSFFTPNHQAYPLLPSVIKYNLIEYPIFTGYEGLNILENRKWLYKYLHKDTFIHIPLVIIDAKTKKEIMVSISEENTKHFSLLPNGSEFSKVPIKLFLIDFSEAKLQSKPIEIKPNKKYPLEKLSGKSLFIFIPKKKNSTQQVLYTDDYYLPLEVHYHSP